MTRAAVLSSCAIATVLGLVWVAAGIGLLIGNATTSVPRGLYVASALETASYVTFCLGDRHRNAPYYEWFCSRDHPDGIGILKRVQSRAADGIVLVAGDTHRALDSRILGPILPGEITGWWRPLIQIKGTRDDLRDAQETAPKGPEEQARGY